MRREIIPTARPVRPIRTPISRIGLDTITVTNSPIQLITAVTREDTSAMMELREPAVACKITPSLKFTQSCNEVYDKARKGNCDKINSRGLHQKPCQFFKNENGKLFHFIHFLNTPPRKRKRQNTRSAKIAAEQIKG